MNRQTRHRGGRSNTHAPGRYRHEVMSDADALGQIEDMKDPFILVLDGVQDPHNLGACMRSADAAGVDFVFAPKKHTSGITETVRRISCGGADRIPYIQVGNLGQLLAQLQELGIILIGTGDEESKLLYECDFRGGIGLVMGSEGRGIRQKIAERCDHLVKIPMIGDVECLNLSVATGVCLFEAVRQRL